MAATPRSRPLGRSCLPFQLVVLQLPAKTFAFLRLQAFLFAELRCQFAGFVLLCSERGLKQLVPTLNLYKSPETPTRVAVNRTIIRYEKN